MNNLKMASESTYEYAEGRSETTENAMDSEKRMEQQNSRLIEENEKYRQDLHALRCKLNVHETMRNELQAINDSLEQAVIRQDDRMAREFFNIEEKHAAEKRDFVTRLLEMETNLTEKSEIIEKLNLKLEKSNRSLQAMTYPERILSPAKDLSSPNNQLEDLLKKLSQKEATCKKLEENNLLVQKEASELKEILNSTRNLLSEKSVLLESVKDELAECRIELDSVKNTPANSNCKGNSLFAEVEDRRQKMLDNMSTMKKGYYEAKRVVHSKDAEIKSLKAELFAVLRKFRDDTIDTIQQNGNLFDKYKARISELELKLKNQQKKIKQLEEKDKPSDYDFSFFQSLVDSKKKEIEELEAQLENVSIQAILEEETKHQMGRQLRYWRCKAMSFEAQLTSIRAHMESSSEFSNSEILKILQDNFSKHSKFEETLDSSHQTPPIVNVDHYPLEELILPSSDPTVRTTAIDKTVVMNDSDESTLKSEGTILMNEKLSLAPHVGFTQPTIPIINQDDISSMVSQRKEARSVSIIENPNASEDIVKENVVPKLKSALKEVSEKEKKTLRFTGETVDPEAKLLRRQFTPKYPIIHISSKKKT